MVRYRELKDSEGKWVFAVFDRTTIPLYAVPISKDHGIDLESIVAPYLIDLNPNPEHKGVNMVVNMVVKWVATTLLQKRTPSVCQMRANNNYFMMIHERAWVAHGTNPAAATPAAVTAPSAAARPGGAAESPSKKRKASAADGPEGDRSTEPNTNPATAAAMTD